MTFSLYCIFEMKMKRP